MRISQADVTSPPAAIEMSHRDRSGSESQSISQNISHISNLAEDALTKLSGATSELGCGFSGFVSRKCVETSHPPYLASAAKFVAVKSHYDDVLGTQANSALLRIAGLRAADLQHVASAKHLGTDGEVGFSLAHMGLDRFIQENTITCKDALVMVRDLSIGLNSLHALGIVHGDLQMRNVLVSPGGYVLGDIDGNAEGAPDGRGGVYTQSLDLNDLYGLFRAIFAEVPVFPSNLAPQGFMPQAGAAFLSDSFEENEVDGFSDIISDALQRDGRGSERYSIVIGAFRDAMSSLEKGARHDAALINVAALADELASALRSKAP